MRFNIHQMKAKEYMPGFFGKAIHGEKITQVYWDIRKNSKLPEHSHLNEQIIYMIEGKFELVVGGQRYVLEDGDVFVLTSHTPHSGKALSDCRILDVFSPVREMFL